MNNNIFKGAKFGDKFLTRDGEISLYIRKKYRHSLYTERGWIECLDDGTYCGMLMGETKSLDIVSKYQEPIDEDKLNEITWEYLESQLEEDAEKAYKAGYRKAING